MPCWKTRNDGKLECGAVRTPHVAPMAMRHLSNNGLNRPRTRQSSGETIGVPDLLHLFDRGSSAQEDDAAEREEARRHTESPPNCPGTDHATTGPAWVGERVSTSVSTLGWSHS